MSLRVVAPGTFSLIVDAGRPSSRGLGVPVGGPADRISMAFGNLLVGNPPDSAAIEITLTGPTLSADADVGVCVFGAPFHMVVAGNSIAPDYTFTLKSGQTLHIGGTPVGCRAYVCLPGGFTGQRVLDSVSAFEPLKAGELLLCESSQLPGRSLSELPAFHQVAPFQLRCLPGPQSDWFDDACYLTEFVVSPSSNRMGLRLDGSAIKMPNRELISEPVAPGAIQMTNEGKPIVLGVDGQTIGGYPKIAHVISADLDLLGQLRPGDRVRFHRVSEAAAETAASQQREKLSMRLRHIAATCRTI